MNEASRVALLMSVCYAVALFHRTAFQGIEADVRGEFGLSASRSADLSAMFFWAYFAVMIPVGLLTDAIGARRAAILGSLVTAVGAWLFGQAHSAGELALARVCIAIGSAAAFVGLMRYVALAFPDRKATYSGRGILMGNVGAIASGVPLAWILAQVSWRSVWLALALTSVALAAGLRFAAPWGERGGATSHGRAPLAELRALATSPYVYLGIAIQAGLAGAYYAFGNLIGPRWLAEQGFDRIAVGWEVTLLVAGYGVGAAFWGWFGDHEHRRTLALSIATCGALAGWCVVALVPAAGAVPASAVVLACGFCCGAFALVYPLIAERHDKSHAGGVVAFVNCGIPLGAALLQSAAGRLPQGVAPGLLLAAAGSVAAAGVLLLLFDRRIRLRLARDPT